MNERLRGIVEECRALTGEDPYWVAVPCLARRIGEGEAVAKRWLICVRCGDVLVHGEREGVSEYCEAPRQGSLF